MAEHPGFTGGRRARLGATVSSPPTADHPPGARPSVATALSELASAIRLLSEGTKTSPTRNSHDPDALLTADELAEILQLPARTVKDQAAAGALPHRRFGKHYRFSRDDLHEIVHRAGYAPAPTTRARRSPGTAPPS